MEPLIASQRIDLNCHPLRRLDSLKFASIAKLITLTLSLNAPETEADTLMPYFEYLFSLCKEILDFEARVDITADHEVYNFESRVVSYLYLIATKCRNGNLRRQAINLLLSSHRREWMFDSYLMGQVASFIVNIEEEGMDEIGYIPEEKRAWGESMELDLQRRRAIVKVRVGRKGTSEWAERATPVRITVRNLYRQGKSQREIVSQNYPSPAHNKTHFTPGIESSITWKERPEALYNVYKRDPLLYSPYIERLAEGHLVGRSYVRGWEEWKDLGYTAGGRKALSELYKVELVFLEKLPERKGICWKAYLEQVLKPVIFLLFDELGLEHFSEHPTFVTHVPTRGTWYSSTSKHKAKREINGGANEFSSLTTPPEFNGCEAAIFSRGVVDDIYELIQFNIYQNERLNDRVVTAFRAFSHLLPPRLRESHRPGIGDERGNILRHYGALTDCLRPPHASPFRNFPSL
ncbi:hypothetical protein G7Y89_g592 [Cudoniella acicularis]|uniref:Uncharacterized protein n=1 Tax=Cudoniella acicularis TaxID=354080 RepID=A0A8H4RXV6_9HELO|nr:hypothetical protein G7Y89_g592 [Cudoniella acicularis]